MFINCPYCNALVATDPASDLPPERCPRCAAALRTMKAEVGRDVAATPKSAAMSPAPIDAGGAMEQAAQGTAGSAEGLLDAVSPKDDDAAAPAVDSRAIDADDVSEAMLGPAAIEIEIERAGTAPDDARDAVSMPKPVPQAEPEPINRLEPAPLPEPAAAAESPPDTPDRWTSSEPPEEAVEDAKVAAAPAVAATRAESRGARSAPSFVRAAGARASRQARGWRAPLAITGLVLLLVLQLLLADRAQLAADARWRPWITSLCGVLHCAVPPWREAGAFTLLGRDVRPHPTIPGALRVTASFRNDARWPQPWPHLALTLSDVEGREAGARSFSAAEYLGAAPTQPGLGSGQTATIAMDVIEPAPRIVAFTFEFH
jgi:hypothetical protein